MHGARWRQYFAMHGAQRTSVHGARYENFPIPMHVTAKKNIPGARGKAWPPSSTEEEEPQNSANKVAMSHCPRKQGMVWCSQTSLRIHLFIYVIFILYTLLSLSWNLGCLTGRFIWVRLQQPQEQCYPVLQVHAGSFHVSIVHDLPNSDMDYRIFNVSMWSFLMRAYIYIHTRGLDTPIMSQDNIFDRKTQIIFLVLPGHPM